MAQKKYDEKTIRRQLAHKLRSQPQEYLLCRDVRHSWEIVDDFHVVTPNEDAQVSGTKLVRDLVCIRCGTERRDVFAPTRNGVDKVGVSYSYPDDYQMKGIPRGVKPQALIRAEEYRRVLEKAAKTSRESAA